MAEVKAKLKVILTADDTVVAEAEDPILWQRVLTAITASKAGAALDLPRTPSAAAPASDVDGGGEPQSSPLGGNQDLAKFAQHLSLSQEVVDGACAPSRVAPFLHLDVHCWEEMKRQLPDRGPNAIGPGVLAATLLGVWFRAAGLGNPTQAQAQKVLATIGVRDQNTSRSIERCEWLQSRSGGVVVLNPAEITKAHNIARSFCSKKWAKVATPGE